MPIPGTQCDLMHAITAETDRIRISTANQAESMSQPDATMAFLQEHDAVMALRQQHRLPEPPDARPGSSAPVSRA